VIFYCLYAVDYEVVTRNKKKYTAELLYEIVEKRVYQD
jgi:hypothetical protein